MDTSASDCHAEESFDSDLVINRPLLKRAISMHNKGDITRDEQTLHLANWFQEFSDIEKDDFLCELLDLFAPGQLPLGIMLNKLKLQEKAPTLFECRMILFKEWFLTWEENDRLEFLNRVKTMDAKFFERFEKSKSTPNEDKLIDEFFLRVPDQVADTVTENGITSEVSENVVASNGHPEPPSEATEVEAEDSEAPSLLAEVEVEVHTDSPVANGSTDEVKENGFEVKEEKPDVVPEVASPPIDSQPVDPEE